MAVTLNVRTQDGGSAGTVDVDEALFGVFRLSRDISQQSQVGVIYTDREFGGNRNRVGGFWEDAQPDWSPVQDRLIYASQREADRRWRLYSSDGEEFRGGLSNGTRAILWR